MIARINHEHAEREKLEQARQELLKRKQALIAENKKRKDDLANLDVDLERFIDVRYWSCPRFALPSARSLQGACIADYDNTLTMAGSRLRNLSKRPSKRSTDEYLA